MEPTKHQPKPILQTPFNILYNIALEQYGMGQWNRLLGSKRIEYI